MQCLNLVKNQAPPLPGVKHKNRKDNKTTELPIFQLSQNKLMNTHLKSLRITWFTLILCANAIKNPDSRDKHVYIESTQ